jgi:predicted dehydrogenase
MKVKVGIIGTGMGIRTMLPIFRATGEAEVLAITGSTPERTLQFAARHGIPRPLGDYRALCDLPELDLICVASPNPHHHEQVSYALAAGKAVLAEKPLALSLEETEKLCALQETGDRPFAIVNHQLRFDPFMRMVRDLLGQGRIGRPYLMRLRQQETAYSGSEVPWSWSFDERSGGGIRLAIGSHLIDLLWFWLGPRKVNGVAGAMNVIVPARRDRSGVVRQVTASDSFAAQLSLEAGLTVQLSSSAALVGESRFDIEVYGTEGELRFDLQSKLRGSFAGSPPGAGIDVDGVTREEWENRIPIFEAAFGRLARAMLRAVREGRPEHVADAATFRQAVRTQLVLDAIRQSTRHLRLVRIDDGYRPGALA